MTKRFYVVAAGLFLGLVASGCRERNPAYIQKVVPDDASVFKDAPADVFATDGGASDVFVPLVDGPTVVVGQDAGPDAPSPGPDGVDLDDGGAIDRDSGRAGDSRNGADDAPDAPADLLPTAEAGGGAAEVGPVADASDAPILLVDGGVDLVSLDTASIDAPPACQESQKRACSTPGNPLVGACRAGSQTCTGGAWGACTGEILPAAQESCNNVDDDCNGLTDEGCSEGCVVVAPGGSDSAGDGTAANPFATLQAGLAFAASVDGGNPRRVCVAGGGTCADSNTYSMDSTLTVPNGARIQGNYALADSTLSYCAATQPPTTRLQLTAADTSVLFGDAVTLHTELGGFVIERFSPANPAPQGGVSTAVRVGGAKNVTLSGIFVTDAPGGDTTYGVDVEAGGQVTIVGSSIGGGDGRLSSVGVYVNGGSVNLRGNCDTLTRGLCTTSCGGAGGVLGIRGRSGTTVVNNAADSSAVYVAAGSPASAIVANMLCGGPGTGNGDGGAANVATLRCEGNGCANVFANTISGGIGQQSLAVSVSNGGGTIDSNAIEAGCGSEEATGVLLSGASPHLWNNRMLGSECASSPGTTLGLRMVLTSEGGEPDVSSNDIDPRGGTGDCESTGVSIDRTQGQPTPAGILRNNIIAAGNCRTRTAVVEGASASLRLIENNDLYAIASSGTGLTTVLFRRASTDATTATQVNALVGAAANISADPKFVSYPGDLHLTAGSPCIDQGSATGAPPDDADGVVRPQGASLDIGAYEFLSP